MVTLKDIADDLGVSVSTVSYVFNNKWRQKGITKRLADEVKKKLKEERYRPNPLALQLRTRRTKIVGVLLSDLTRSFSLSLLSGVEKILASADYAALVYNSNHGVLEEKYIEALLARDVDGIIWDPSAETQALRLTERLIQENSPFVLVDNYLPGRKTDFVVSDNFWGSYQATEFLLNKGCRKIAYIGGKRLCTASKERFDGYASALRKKNLDLSPEIISRKVVNSEDIYLALQKIFSRKKPEAIFSESLLYFKEGFRFLREKGLKIPDDIALTGFDPVELTLNETHQLHLDAVVKEPIPFVEQQGIEIGESAAGILLNKMGQKKKVLSRIFLKPNLRFFTKVVSNKT